MIDTELLRESGILIITPVGALQQSDFEGLAQIVDPYIAQHGALHGLMIYTQSFPHWQDFKALVTHIRFVADHQNKITKIAAVTNNTVLSILPSIVTHFLHAEVRHFDYVDKEVALAWLKGSGG